MASQAVRKSQESDQENSGPSQRPSELASLLDPKNLDALGDLGGIDALLNGLGTHPSENQTWAIRWRTTEL
ncbi:hypothetical protein K503DRAFT_806317 [Rhizopogon vinicolor AM-OR11-026]|uniref:Uncharacterized protein n=1 Tax=Rhizopogon vinicolor AM-OR11-026 TaxID=1314800 RepID=A0A1B7MF03_9AGAM|nr:hypothetical protein K503DRAFT_806317 [Rhizopogon vinicolor AM-OR11-026]